MINNILDQIKKIEHEFAHKISTASRKPLVVRLRWCVMFVLRERGFSYTQIGDIFNKDHSTVMYGLEKVSGNQSKFTQISRVREILLGTDAPPVLAVNIKRSYKKWQRFYKEKGHACEICNHDDVVEVHHKDPLEPNISENIMILCPNHHAMVHKGLISIKGYNRCEND